MRYERSLLDQAIRFIQLSIFLWVVMSSSWAAVTPQEQTSFNAEFGEFLKGKTLAVNEVYAGMKIPMNSILTVPWAEEPEKLGSKNSITIAFKRDEVDLVFLKSLFDKHNVGGSLPFAARGMETVLTRDFLKVTLHEGVFIHLRPDLPGPAGNRILVSDTVVGVVTEVHGKALVSSERVIIRERFADAWTGFQPYGRPIPCVLGKNCSRNPDGTVSIHIDPTEQTQWKFPHVYTPRIQE